MPSDRGLTIALAGQALVTSRPSAPPDPAIREFLADCDAAFCNFEGVVRPPEGGFPTRDRTIHASPPGVLSWLRETGFSLVSLANNHAFDLGPAGIAATREAAAEAGLLGAGTGTVDEALAPVFQETANGRIALIAADAGPHPAIQYARRDPEAGDRLGVALFRLETILQVAEDDFRRMSDIADASGHAARIAARRQVGYPVGTDAEALDFFGQAVIAGAGSRLTHHVNSDDWAAMAAAIASARTEADCVLVSVHQHHWGPNWTRAPDWVEPVGRNLIDAGADIVAVHGNPRCHGVAEYKGKPIATGLGNLLFQTRRAARYQDPSVWRSSILKIAMGTGGTLQSLTELPITVPRDHDMGPMVAGT